MGQDSLYCTSNVLKDKKRCASYNNIYIQTNTLLSSKLVSVSSEAESAPRIICAAHIYTQVTEVSKDAVTHWEKDIFIVNIFINC